MTTDYDPRLQELFNQAEQDLDSDLFTQDVSAEIGRQRRRTILLWSGFGVLALVVIAFLVSPLIATLQMATQLLPTSIVEVETQWLQLLLAPINSVAAIIALGFLGIRRFYRRIFR